MSTEDLLRRLADAGVQLYLDGDRLHFRAPPGALSQEWREEIAARRMVIVLSLANQRVAAAATEHGPGCDRRFWVDDPSQDGRIRTTCSVCGRFIGYRPAEIRMGTQIA